MSELIENVIPQEVEGASVEKEKKFNQREIFYGS